MGGPPVLSPADKDSGSLVCRGPSALTPEGLDGQAGHGHFHLLFLSFYGTRVIETVCL